MHEDNRMMGQFLVVVVEPGANPPPENHNSHNQ